MPLHPHMQRLDAGDGEECVHRRERGAKVAQGHRPRLHGEGEIAEILVEPEPVIGGLRLGQRGKATPLRPVELARFDHDAAQRIAVAGEEFGGRVDDDIGAVLDRPAEVRGGERVVDDQRQTGLMCDFGDAPISTTTPPGLARFSMKIALHFGVSALRKFSGSVGSTKWQVQPSFLNERPN